LNPKDLHHLAKKTHGLLAGSYKVAIGTSLNMKQTANFH
jgi:hypothetical protein